MSWSNKKHPTISLGPIEAEYKSLCSATCDFFFVRRILEDMRERKGVLTSIKCDNQSSIKLANNPIYHVRSKHIETEHHSMREKIQSR
jgi:hypothetical protein